MSQDVLHPIDCSIFTRKHLVLHDVRHALDIGGETNWTVKYVVNDRGRISYLGSLMILLMDS